MVSGRLGPPHGTRAVRAQQSSQLLPRRVLVSGGTYPLPGSATPTWRKQWLAWKRSTESRPEFGSWNSEPKQIAASLGQTLT